MPLPASHTRLRPSSLGPIAARRLSRSTDLSAVVTVALIVLALALLVGAGLYPIRRGRHLVEVWAQEHGYAVVEVDHRWIATGPFFFRKAKHQNIYHVALRDRAGRPVTGYARTGGWFLGTALSSTVTVRLDP